MFNIIRDKKVIALSAAIIVCFVFGFFLFNKESNVYAEDGVNLETKEEPVVEEVSVNQVYKFDIKGYVVNPGVYEFEYGDCINDAIKKAGGLTKESDTSIINLSKKLSDEEIIRIYSKNEVNEYKSVLNTTPEDIVNSLNKKISASVNLLFESNFDDKVLLSKKNALIERYSKEANIEYSAINDIKLELSGSYIIGSNNSIEDKNSTENNANSDLININTATKEKLMTLTGVGESRATDIIKYREKSQFKSIDEIQNVNGIGEESYKKIQNNITI